MKSQELEDKMVKYTEKEVKMRNNVKILEEESKKIYNLVQQKEENEEKYELMIQDKDTTIQILKNNENQLVDTFEKMRIDSQKKDKEIKDLQSQLMQINTSR